MIDFIIIKSTDLGSTGHSKWPKTQCDPSRFVDPWPAGKIENRAKLDWKSAISLQRGQFNPKFLVERFAPTIIFAWLVRPGNALQLCRWQSTYWPRVSFASASTFQHDRLGRQQCQSTTALILNKLLWSHWQPSTVKFSRLWSYVTHDRHLPCTVLPL